jgi:hypothetical protein
MIYSKSWERTMTHHYSHTQGAVHHLGAVWPQISGWKRWLTVANADHFSFTDLDLLVQQITFHHSQP